MGGGRLEFMKNEEFRLVVARGGKNCEFLKVSQLILKHLSCLLEKQFP